MSILGKGVCQQRCLGKDLTFLCSSAIVCGALRDTVPPSLQILPHTHILAARSPAPYSPTTPCRAHSPTAFSGLIAHPPPSPAYSPCSNPQAGPPDSASHSTVLARLVCPFVCVRAASFPCARPLLPSSDRSAGQRNQPSHSTVLARPMCPVKNVYVV